MTHPRYSYDENPTIFGKILRNEIPCTKVYEDDVVLAFHDIAPKAPIHVVVVPKQHLVGLQATTDADAALLGQIMARLNTIAEKLGVAQSGYRVVTNAGENAGQSVPHLHFHILANKPGAVAHLPGFE
jgi:histidine triad (HIT) family protein